MRERLYFSNKKVSDRQDSVDIRGSPFEQTFKESKGGGEGGREKKK